MPIREYRAVEPDKGCARCKDRFENLETPTAPPLQKCPECGAPLERLLSAPAVGSSKSGFDARAKNAGFHKLKRVDKGTYEKMY